MLGLFLIFFIGKTFYALAGEYDKSQWTFAILGVVAYYGGTFIAGLGMALYFEFNTPGSIESMDTFLLGFIGIPFGLLACWGLYALLKKKWSKEVVAEGNGMLDDEFLK